MFRTTTLLIVMVLTGGPTSSLACELWCSAPAAEDHHRTIGCHDASTSAPMGQQIGAVGGCHDAVAVAPYVTEARQAESESAATQTAVLLGAMTLDVGRVAAGLSVFQVRPLRSPLLHTVLRI